MRTGIGLGSNVGDRLAYLREGFRRIRSLHTGSKPLLVSSVFETSPIDCAPGTNPYLNAAVEIQFSRHPIVLLDALLGIEREMGRPSKRPRNAPRTIDLDVLYVGNLILNNPEIIIPHPRLPQRRFVLDPLSQIAPELILPGQTKTIRTLLENLTDNERVVRTEAHLEDSCE
ncbi:MAG TPA: 2-amino-4-hydroxy-6-hydroxymethyldihydropteridine diphosphokinase [Chthoniobacterales bacterium]|nr:2-amino-4-hydroxy-6-hydroxymethyldihydropteridine diphosphokinase [Chthoniobacterales bacterium]